MDTPTGPRGGALGPWSTAPRPGPTDPWPAFLTAAQLASIFGWDRHSVQGAISKGLLPAVTWGHCRFIEEPDAREYARRRVAQDFRTGARRGGPINPGHDPLAAYERLVAWLAADPENRRPWRVHRSLDHYRKKRAQEDGRNLRRPYTSEDDTRAEDLTPWYLR